MGIKGDGNRVDDKDKFDEHFDQIYGRFYCASCQLTFNGFIDTRCEQCGGIPYELGGQNESEEVEELIKVIKARGC